MRAIKTVKTAIVGENPEYFIRYDDPSVEEIQEDEDQRPASLSKVFE